MNGAPVVHIPAVRQVTRARETAYMQSGYGRKKLFNSNLQARFRM